MPIHLIGSAVIAMFIGMFLNQFVRKTDVFATGLKFTFKKILKFAIILLGLSLNITTILHVGQMSLTVMVCALAAIGLNTSFASMKKAGIRPMIPGFIISALVVIVALLVEMGMGIV